MMNLIEFYATYQSYGDRDTITIGCGVEGCNKTETILKSSAYNNIKNNGQFKCRTHCYTEEGLKKIAEANSYKRSDETKNLMAAAKKEFYKTPAGIACKAKLSLLTAKGHSENKYVNASRQGWYPSTKTKQWMFYGSSYELRLCWLLDQDETVETYETQISYKIDGRGRCLDCLIKYKNGDVKAVEVKSEDRSNETAFIEQIADSKANAELNGWYFEVYTENTLGMTCRELRNWADEIREKITGVDYKAFRMEKNREKSRNWYWQHKEEKLTSIPCTYCNIDHIISIDQYNINFKKNGRYICIVENGYLVGKLPKDHLRVKNPFIADGKKQCNECDQILLLECFSPKDGGDGFMAKCKKCRAKINREKHQQKNKENPPTN